MSDYTELVVQSQETIENLRIKLAEAALKLEYSQDRYRRLEARKCHHDEEINNHRICVRCAELTRAED